MRWAGVRFQHLLDLVEPLPEATAIRFVSMEEPYDDSLTLEQAKLPDVMLAYELDGKPLSRPHGSPARVVIPEMYGYKGVKWLDADGARGAAADRLLGRTAATTRTRGWGGRMATVSRAGCARSRGRSAPCTGCTRRRSWSCSRPASRSTCRAWPRRWAGGRC